MVILLEEYELQHCYEDIQDCEKILLMFLSRILGFKRKILGYGELLEVDEVVLLVIGEDVANLR